MPIEKSSGAVIFKQEGGEPLFLLLHYNAGHWDLPKGHIEKGEKSQEAAAREIKEETGIADIKFMEGFEEWIKYFFKHGGKTIFKIVTFFLAQTQIKEVKISHEHKGFQWLPYERALKKLTYNNAKKVLKKANRYLESWTKKQNCAIAERRRSFKRRSPCKSPAGFSA